MTSSSEKQSQESTTRNNAGQSLGISVGVPVGVVGGSITDRMPCIFSVEEKEKPKFWFPTGDEVQIFLRIQNDIKLNDQSAIQLENGEDQDKFEVNENEIQMGEFIGSGAYGTVHLHRLI